METLKCSGCGATLDYDESKDILKCQYCGTVHKNASTKKNFEQESHQQPIINTEQIFNANGERPTVNAGVIVFLLLFGFFPLAILYWFIIKIRQNSWDNANRNKK
ncbi:MAG: hypothetical protein IJD48_03260 [Clostridia bacterium]|nr:hypothetical protein [Clostridia bacterium]